MGDTELESSSFDAANHGENEKAVPSVGVRHTQRHTADDGTDADLQRVIETWHRLTEEQQRQVMRIIDDKG